MSRQVFVPQTFLTTVLYAGQSPGPFSLRSACLCSCLRQGEILSQPRRLVWAGASSLTNLLSPRKLGSGEVLRTMWGASLPGGFATVLLPTSFLGCQSVTLCGGALPRHPLPYPPLRDSCLLIVIASLFLLGSIRHVVEARDGVPGQSPALAFGQGRQSRLVGWLRQVSQVLLLRDQFGGLFTFNSGN